MGSRHHHSKRSLSPGTQKLVIPGRASDTSFASSYGGGLYSGYPHSARDDYRRPSVSSTTPPRKTGGVIPISTEIVYKDGATSRDAYSGRPRRSSDLVAPQPSLRSRPAAVVQDVAPRPSSPLSRSYDARDPYVKPNTSIRRSEPKATKLYNVGDNGSAKLIAETEPYRDKRDPSRHERSRYHLTGRSRRPQEVDESSWSYTDPAGMYNDTEPTRRPRRGSVDGRRPTSVLEPPGYQFNHHRNSRDYGPPITTRQFNKVNDLARASSVREPVRGSSRERQGTYDSHGHREPYEMGLRSSSTMPVVVNQPEHRHARDDGHYQESYEDYREPRRSSRQIADENVQSRGFGIRMPSVDRHGGSSSSSVEPPVPRSVYPQSSAMYGDQALVKMPSSSEYAVPAQVDDRRDKPGRREREREREWDRDYERDRPKDWDRPRERDYERDDRGERHHHQHTTADSVRDSAAPVAAAAAGLAGVTAAGAYEKKRNDRKYESDDDRAPRSRHELNNRDDERDPWNTKDRDEKRDREDRRDREEKRDRDDRRDKEERRDRDRDREEKKREDKPAIDPDEDYRRRVQQAQAELQGLTKTRSKDDERADPDRQRRREREERERERRQSQDRGSRRGSDESSAPRRARAPSIDSQGSAQHNRLAVTDRGFAHEPESMPGAYPRESHAPAGAMAPPPPASVTPAAAVAAGSMLPVPDVAPRSKSVDPSASVTSSERRVTIVEPPKDDGKAVEPPLRGILRKPTEKFPEHPDTHREGVTPLKDRLKKDGGGKEIPDGAKWTKIDRRLVNPQALEEKGERFEERQDYVIVLKVLTKDEIQAFANRTAEIREDREERYNREKKRHSAHGGRPSHHHHDYDDTEDSDDRDFRHSSRRSHRDEDRDSHRTGRDDGDRDREPRSSRTEYDNDYENENESAVRAIEEGRRKERGSRDLRDEYMSGGLNSGR